MVDVLTEIIINRPRDMVSEYAADPDNAPEWYVNIKSAEWQTPKPLAIGAKIAFKAQFLGKQLAYVYRIVDYKTERLLVMQTADGPFRWKRRILGRRSKSRRYSKRNREE